MVKKRPAACNRPAAAQPSEWRRLTTRLNTRVYNKQPGAAEIKQNLKKVPKDQQLQWLRNNLVTSEGRGRRFLEKNMTPDIGKPSQAKDVVVKRFGARTVVVKTFVHFSKALKRTLSIYGHVREQGLETQLTLPKLLSVDCVGDYIF